jgi:hypothetical protein
MWAAMRKHPSQDPDIPAQHSPAPTQNHVLRDTRKPDEDKKPIYPQKIASSSNAAGFDP